MSVFVARCAAVLKANTTLMSMITAVQEFDPPIIQSPQTTLIPAVYVSPSVNAIYRTEVIGRDSLDAAGARAYILELYNVVVARGDTRQAGRASAEKIAAAVRDSYMKDMRLKWTAEPICETLEVLEIPYVLRSDTPEISAINVVCRPRVPVSLRT